MLNFNFPEKGLGLVSASHFVYKLSRKMFLMLYSINWPNAIVWLPLLLEILDNMCITIVCYPGCDVIKFEINFIFLIKLFCYMTKKLRQKFKYLKNGKSFWGEIKSIFHHFYRAYNCQKLSQTWECAFKMIKNRFWTSSFLTRSIKRSNSFQPFSEDLLKYITESLISSTLFCDNFLKFTVIFSEGCLVRLWPVRNTLDNILLNVSNTNKESYKAMRNFDLVHLLRTCSRVYLLKRVALLVLTQFANNYNMKSFMK